MSWAKIDDRANEHRKMLAAGAEACWLWACGLMYANRQPARDGFIPEAVLAMLYPFKYPKRLVSRLIDAGLWEKAPGGYQIHEFTLWNQTKEQVEERKAKARERAAKSYERKKMQIVSNSAGDSAAQNARREHDSAERRKRDSAGSPPLPSASPTTTTTVPEVVVVPTLADRARRVLENPHDGQWSRPSQWPEILQVCKSWSFGMVIRLRDFADSDSDLKAILQAFADGYTVDQLLEAGRVAQSSPYFAKLTSPGPTSFTPAVIRRLLAPATARTGSAGDETGGFGKTSEWTA